MTPYSALICPTTHLPLERRSRDAAQRSIGSPGLRAAAVTHANTVECSDEVLLRADLELAYPFWQDFPVLMAPEALVPPSSAAGVDVGDPRYAEAYSERDHYNEVAAKEAATIERSPAFMALLPALKAPPSHAVSFPAPRETWIDAPFDCRAQWTAYEHLAPVDGRLVMQLGGKGIHAVRMLLAGARQAWLATPIPGEARVAQALAEHCGAAERLHTVIAIAEELPFPDAYFDVVYSGGCLHHTVTDLALPEVARTLRPGGRFAAVDPWRAPLYGVGTRVLGKRERGVFCRPLDWNRLAGLAAFAHSTVVSHGALTRYLLLALSKLGVALGMNWNWRIMTVDDALSARLGRVRRAGSSVAVLATR